MGTVSNENICWACTTIYIVLLSTECWSFSGNHQNTYWVFNKVFHIGVGYSSVNTPRSVLSVIIKTENEILFGELPLVCRSLKRAFNLRTSFPGYSTAWDVSVVLKYIKSLKALKQYVLNWLLYPLPILLYITTGLRDQTLF